MDEGRQSAYGDFPKNRTLENHIRQGFINLDKPAGPTSHEVVSILKEILGIDKAGHSGTLDPHVTGVLPIGLLDSTKVLSSLLLAPKTYICNMYSSKPFEQDEIINIFEYLTGEIYQFPPKKSNVAKRLRTRRIYNLELLDMLENECLFEVRSEAGTYIRTLCKDIGRIAGNRAYMKELRRIQTGPFVEKHTVTLHQVFDAWQEYLEGNEENAIREIIQPVEKAIEHLPKVILKDSAIDPICHGTDLSIPGIAAYTNFYPGTMVALMSAKGEIIALGTAMSGSDSIAGQKKGNIIHPDKIVMSRGIYPTYHKKL